MYNNFNKLSALIPHLFVLPLVRSFKYAYSCTVFSKIKNDFKTCTILEKVVFGESTYGIERKMAYKEKINYIHSSHFKM